MDRKYKASYFEQRFRNRIYEVIIRALESECAAKGWKRKDIAAHSGKKESQISRWLSGPGNWTLDTVSTLLYAIDSELDFAVTKFKDKPRRNEFHPLNEHTSAYVVEYKQEPPKKAYLPLDPVRSGSKEARVSVLST